jgi:hypothetical protein
MRAMLVLVSLALAACVAALPDSPPVAAQGNGGPPNPARVAKGPPILPDPDAIRVEGVWLTGTPCGRVVRDDGSHVVIHIPLRGLTPGMRVVVLGEAIRPMAACGEPALVVRRWSPAP